MARIIVESTNLEMIACELDTGCAGLSMVSDEDDIEEVEFYSGEIQRVADALRQIIRDAEPEEGVHT